MEDRLARALPHVDDDPVVVEACGPGRVGHELQHSLRLLGRELEYLAEAVDVALRQDEQVGVRLRVDVANGDEAVRRMDVLALANKLAEEAVVRQPESPPR
jgi:hypothetical protein